MKFNRKRKLLTFKTPDNLWVKIVISKSFKVQKYNVWWASLVVGKSIRQVNDWLGGRRNKRTNFLYTTCTGKSGIKAQLKAVNQIEKWAKEIPEGDCIYIQCQSIDPNKQFVAWKKWIEERYSFNMNVNTKHKSFLICGFK